MPEESHPPSRSRITGQIGPLVSCNTGRRPKRKSDIYASVVRNAEILTPNLGPVVRYGRDFAREAAFFNAVLHRYRAHPYLVLDAGCGDCTLTRHLAHYHYRITAFDRDERMIPASENLPGNVSFLNSDISELNGKYDGLIASNSVLNYSRDMSDAEKFLREANRLLKQFGILIIEVTNYDNPDIGSRDVCYPYGRLCSKTKRADVHLRSIVNGHTNELVFLYALGKKRRTEKMNLLIIRRSQALRLLQRTGFHQVASYGDYSLDDEHGSASKTMIIVARKTRLPPT